MMTDREKRYRTSRRAKGLTQVAVWLTPEEQAKLTAVMESQGLSKSDAIRKAIMQVRIGGFMELLSPEQLAAALAYDGPDC